MSFPTRVTRSALGPRFRDVYPVENPETDVGAEQFNAAFDQLAGLNVVAPRVALIATWNGSAFDVRHQAEAWNPDGGQAHPALARAGVGRYTYTFAASYLDADGNTVATSLLACRLSVFGVPAADASSTDPYASRRTPMAWVDPGNPLVVKIAIFSSAGAVVDEPFWLEVL
jgi:hypothetical protein